MSAFDPSRREAWAGVSSVRAAGSLGIVLTGSKSGTPSTAAGIDAPRLRPPTPGRDAAPQPGSVGAVHADTGRIRWVEWDTDPRVPGANLDRGDPASAGRTALALALRPLPDTRAARGRLAARIHDTSPGDPSDAVMWALALLRSGESDAAFAAPDGLRFGYDPAYRGIVGFVPIPALRASGKVDAVRARCREAL